MKKTVLLLTLALFLVRCTSTSSFNYRDDFKSLNEKETQAFLKSKSATSDGKSVVILTQGFKGEQVTATQNNKTIYKQYPISNLKTKYADSFSFNNTSNLVIEDNFLKKQVTIPVKEAKEYKFVYVMIEGSGSDAKYKITFSHKLRPLD